MTRNEAPFSSIRRSWLMAVAVLVLLLPASSNAADHSQFNGDWKLNSKESDNAKEKIEDAMEAAGGGKRRGGLLRRRGASEQMQQAMERLADASENITLQVEGDNFTVESGGRSRTFVANGETRQQQGERGSIEVKSQWQGGKLVTRAKTSRGAEINSTYSLSSDAKKLHVVREIEGERLKDPLVIRLVYDRKS